MPTWNTSVSKRMHEERSNESILAKRRHLEDFIARNKARASTATLAKSKSKQLERLELTEIASDEPTARIRAPRVEPRKGPALRCRDLAIGYPERQIATDVQLEIDHGSRAAVVGDNGQGKDDFSADGRGFAQAAGRAKCAGASAARSASTPSTSTPACRRTRPSWSTFSSRPPSARRIRRFSKWPAPSCSAGRMSRSPSRSCPAASAPGSAWRGCCLSEHNVLILDEPGNHLDVDTVEALAEALLDYEGTVIFTSHDRHFTTRVATCIIEVRDGRVTNYSGQYEAYVYKVNKEIEAGERELARPSSEAAAEPWQSPPRRRHRPARRNEREVRKEIKTLEKTIAQLDEQKRALNAQLLQSTDAAEALRLHNEVAALTEQLAEAEERWCQLQEEIEGND